MTNSISQKVLLVDDDPALLDAFRRAFRKTHDLHTAISGQDGLKALEKDGPFAVVVSDYQMPGMNGIEFLKVVETEHPEVIRVMLTGNADLQSAVDAVNEGHVFRFLTKPCEAETFAACLKTAFDQYALEQAERTLLEDTLRGSIAVLADVLALAKPAAFGRATRIRNYVRQIATAMQLPNSWEFETAALLSQIGCVAIPDDIIDRVAAGEKLSDAQFSMMDRHPEVARDILKKIPRMENAAEMIYHQQENLDSAEPVSKDVKLGGQMLRAALQFEENLSCGASREHALNALKSNEPPFDRRILRALTEAELQSSESVVQLLDLKKLTPGMVLDEDIRKTDDTLIVPKGHEITVGSLQRLANFAELGMLVKSAFKVTVQGKQDGSVAA